MNGTSFSLQGFATAKRGALLITYEGDEYTFATNPPKEDLDHGVSRKLIPPTGGPNVTLYCTAISGKGVQITDEDGMPLSKFNTHSPTIAED